MVDRFKQSLVSSGYGGVNESRVSHKALFSKVLSEIIHRSHSGDSSSYIVDSNDEWHLFLCHKNGLKCLELPFCRIFCTV